MANGKPNTARRREVRKAVPKPGPSWQGIVRRREVGYAVLYSVLLVGLCAAICIPYRQGLSYHLNELVTQPVVARVAFEAVDEGETQKEREKASENTPPVYAPNTEFYDAVRERFASLIQRTDAQDVDEIPEDIRQSLKLTGRSFQELKNFAASDQSMAEWEKLTNGFLRNLFDLAILDPEQYLKETGNRGMFGNTILIDHPDPRAGQATRQLRNDFVWISLDDTKRMRDRIQQFALHFPPPLQDTIVELVMVDPKPTYIYSEVKTKEAQQQAFDNVEPEMTRFNPGEVFIAPGTKIAATQMVLLEAERAAYRKWLKLKRSERADTDPGRNVALLAYRPLFGELGYLGLLALIAVGLWVYVFRYYPRIAANPMRGLAVTGLVVLALAASVGAAGVLPLAEHAYNTLPTLLVVMILAIVYDRRFALFVGGLHVLLTAVSLRLDVGFALMALTGVGVTAALLGDVRSRSKLVLTGLYAGLAMAGAAFLVALADAPLDVPYVWTLVSWDVVFALVSGFAAGLFVQGVLPLIEKVFRVTTTMTLKELNDASHPLLQRLAQEAPGTYQHSLRLADITEAAADAIGCDGLLCRVGAMYHDVGKMNKPMYFIENQGGGPNKHAKLSPAMSLLIIVGHVKDGIEMAREYALPQVLRHFIESHHGTTLAEYFYHAARKQQEEADQPAPSEFEFRYPGPKPQTKEAAIMLVCDGIEAAARTVDDPTPVRLEQLVHNIAMKRLMDGQFDDCALTLQDLAKAETAITKTLCAIYHARVKYPEGKKKPAAEEPSAERQVQAKTA